MKTLKFIIFFVFIFSNPVIAAKLKEDFSWEKYKNIIIKNSIQDIESRNLRNATEKERIKLINEFDAQLVQLEKEKKETKIEAREAQKKFKRIYQSKKSKKILTCKQKKNSFKRSQANQKVLHSGYLDIIIYDDEPRIIIINSFTTQEGHVLDTKEGELKFNNARRQFKLNNLNSDEYLIKDTRLMAYPVTTYSYSINTKKNEISFYRMQHTNKINELLFSTSCSQNNKKLFWDLAKTPFSVENEKQKRALEKKDKKKILSKEKEKLVKLFNHIESKFNDNINLNCIANFNERDKFPNRFKEYTLKSEKPFQNFLIKNKDNNQSFKFDMMQGKLIRAQNININSNDKYLIMDFDNLYFWLINKNHIDDILKSPAGTPQRSIFYSKTGDMLVFYFETYKCDDY